MNFESPKWGRGALDEVVVVDDETARAPPAPQHHHRDRRRRAGAGRGRLLMFGRGGGETRPAGAPRPATKRRGRRPRVTVVVPGRQQVARTITATGTLAARRDMPVGVAGEGGKVVRVLVEPGQWVGAGQVLAVIDRSVQAQQAAQLAAQIEVARADAAPRPANLDRAQALVGRGFISKADLDQKRATRDAAAARVRVAQAQLGADPRPDRPARRPRARPPAWC